MHLQTATDDTSALVNLELEQGVLGMLLGDTDIRLWPQIAGRLKPEHFTDGLHSRIFEAGLKLTAQGTPATAVTLSTYFAKDRTLDEIGGVAYLARLMANAITEREFRGALDLLPDLAARRAIIAASKDVAEVAQAVAPGETFRPTLGKHIEALQQLFDSSGVRRTTSTFAEGAQAMVDRVNRMKSGEADPNAIKTGIAALDKKTGGLHRGEYIILGARPGMGKTATALQIAYNIARAGGGVLYFSLEMPHSSLIPRLASTHLWTASGATCVPYNRIIRADLNDMETRWLSAFAREIDGWPFLIDDAPGLTPADMESRAQVQKARFEMNGRDLSVIIVDHLHKMRQPGAQSKVAEYTEISARLAEMAKRLNCPVLTLAQLNRSVESRDDKRPQLSDLRESGSIEQDADVAMFLYRPAYYLERDKHADMGKEVDRIQALRACQNRLDLIIEKQRSGSVGTLELYCDIANNAVHDLEDGPITHQEDAA